ncbi:MAG: hypothetical protein M1814_001775 [Vezdaea aestivalis]|nr:MAG: hypothetical protein M1814_001775 [Vezdaea aestivalis]
MVKPLAFKGDKKLRKRKRNANEDGEPETSGQTNQQIVRAEDSTEDDNSWTSSDVPTDITGPIIIILPSKIPTVLATDANGTVFPSMLENLIDGNPATAEPHDVRQVWIANQIAGTDTFTFKGHHKRYLGCEKVGVLSAAREAVSPEESWSIIPAPSAPGLFAIQSSREGFVSIEEQSKDGGKLEVRGDSESIAFGSSLRIRMQSRYKPKLKAGKAEKAREKISRKELETVVGRRLEDDEVKRLKKARREGTYHETILDVRVKGKHDKFASF